MALRPGRELESRGGIPQQERAEAIGSSSGDLAVVQQGLGEVHGGIITAMESAMDEDVHAPSVVGRVVGLQVFQEP